MTLRPRLNTNHPFSSVIGRFQAGRFRVRFWETCDGGAARGSDGILDLTFAALPCIVFQLCLSLAI